MDADRGAPRRWWGLVIVCLGMMMTFLTITQTLATITAAQRDLHASASGAVWMGSIYTAVVAALVLTAGTVGDILGRRLVFLLGAVVMAAGSAVVLFGGDTTTVIVGQAVMGVGGAMILPNSLALATGLFGDPHERTTAVSIWAAVSGVGLALGPIVGGLLLLSYSWHSVFAINVVLAVVVVVLTLVLVDERRAPGRRLDVPGLVLGIVAIGALSYAVIEGGNVGFGEARIIVAFCVAGVAVVAFVLAEHHSSAPMLHLGLFRNLSFVAANLVGFLGQFTFVGLSFVLVLYFEQVNAYTTLSAGTRMLALTATYVVVSAFASRVVRWLGFRWPMVVGLVATGAGALLLLTVDPTTDFWIVALILVLVAAGSGLILTPSTALAVISVPPTEVGTASGSVNMFRQIGGAVGASLLGTLLTTGLFDALPGALVARGVPAAGAARLTAGAAEGGSLSELPAAVVRPFVAAFGESFTDAFHTAVLVPAIAALVCAVLAGVLVRPARKPATAAAPAPVQPAPEASSYVPGAPIEPAPMSVGGRLSRDNGAPVTGGVLTLIDALGVCAGRGTVDHDGRYHLDRPRGGGMHMLVAAAPGHIPRAAHLPTTPGHHTLDLVLAGGTGLGGRIHGPDGEAVAGARVTVTDTAGEVAGTTTSGADGRYALHGLTAGIHTLTAIAEGRAPVAERVDVAADGIARCDLVLAVLRRIAGTALDSASRPLANLTVSLADAAGRAVATATTDGGGRYAFDGVGPGEFVVTATRYVPVTATVPVGSNGAEQHLVLGATA
ncbi:MAG: MFS transporter [Pseudonocardia sp.]|uniref:MFS transporter n=1 Tax=Pseudonocardia sp. TaxID=60912 RepID=UPI001AD41D13|nr:MFS transporter [Pseudonocardia sp.]MBN9101251.1 MFS transporter [Pseudonocardia sp.]